MPFKDPRQDKRPKIEMTTKVSSTPWRTVKCHNGLTIRFKTVTKTTTTVEDIQPEE